MAYTGIDLQAPFDPSGYATLTAVQVAQLVGGLAPIAGLTGMCVVTTDDGSGNPVVPNPATYPKLVGYLWLRIGNAGYTTTPGATLLVWNPNAASGTLLKWQIANVNSITNGSITGSQIAALTITDGNILSVGWSKLPSGGTVGGCLVGSMPNPTLANNAVGNSNISPLSVDYTRLIPSGTAYQQLQVNAGATAVQWFTPVTPLTVVTGALVLTTGVAATIAHGLGGVPSRVRVVIACTTTDSNTGYTAPCEIDLKSLVYQACTATTANTSSTTVIGAVITTTSNFIFYADATNVYIINGGATAKFITYNGGTTATPSSTTNFVFKCYVGL